MWLGDNHCASKHVQSSQHSNNYSEFIVRNPHWEVDWLTERTRSYERNSEVKQPQVLRSLSDQLFAMIKANSKKHEPPLPAPPPPPPLNSASSSSEDDSLDRKYKKKSKKSKKKLNKDNASSIATSTKEVGLTSEKIKLNYKSMPEIKVVPVEDSFISEWMPRVVKHEPVHLTKRPRDEDEERRPKKITRHASVGSSEMSSDTDKKSSPYDYNDNDDAIIFNKRATSNSKELKNKRKFEEERSSRYNSKESSKEKSKYDDKYKYKGLEKYNKYERELKYEDHKEKRDSKTFKEPGERNKKSPIRKTKDSMMKKKIKSKLDNKSDEDTHETSFEKRTSESAAKKKDVKKMVLNNLSKTKLPFIGRMPILKKKVDQKPDEKEEKKENLEEEVMKDVIPSISPEVNVPEIITTNEGESSVEELPKSTLIITKRPRLAEPGIVRKEILFNKPANDNLTEQDMELDEEIGVTKDEEPAKDELHKDFKDALELLFPEEKKAEDGQEGATQVESEIKLEEQPQVVTAAGSYIMPAGYEVGMYPTYYEQHAYIQQQWAQMGYDQTGQYAGAYAYPPPMEQPLLEVVQPSPVIEVPPPEPPKKKKNPLSQRMRRHLKKKKEKEAQKDNAGIEEDTVVEGDLEEDEDEVSAEGKPSNSEDDLKAEQEHRPSDMSDLALLGIDEDDAAAQGLH